MKGHGFYRVLSLILAGTLMLTSAGMPVYAQEFGEETPVEAVREPDTNINTNTDVNTDTDVNTTTDAITGTDLKLGTEEQTASEEEQLTSAQTELPVYADAGTGENTADTTGQNIRLLLDANGGEVSPTELTVVPGESCGELPVPVWEGYRFDGWFTEQESGDRVTEETTAETAAEEDSITLFAHWTRIFRLTLKLEGGLLSKLDSTVYEIESGKTVNEALADLYAELELEGMEEPVRTGYTFNGWYAENATDIQFNFDSVLTEDTCVYAVWKALYQVEAPASSIEAGTETVASTEIEADAVIRLSTVTPDAQIYYTTDNRDITTETEPAEWEGRKLYTDGLVAGKLAGEDRSITIKAYAVKEGSADSEVVTFTYTVKDPDADWGEITKEDQRLFVTEEKPDGDPSKVPSGLWIGGIKEDGYPYTGSNITFTGDTENAIRVYDGKTLLEEGKDYKLSYKNNKNAYEWKEGNEGYNAAKAPTVTVTGMGNYAGSMMRTFVINRADLSAKNGTGTPMFHAEDITVAYSGKIQKGLPKVIWTTEDGKQITLKANTDYVCTYPKTDSTATDHDPNAFVAASETPYEIHIAGKGNYTGELICYQQITGGIPMSKVKVAAIPAQDYEQGKSITPVVSVTYAGEMLTLYNEKTGTGDYTVEYKDNTLPGTATVLLTGKGNYAGTCSVTFQINGIDLKKANLTGFITSYVYTGDKLKQDEAVFTYTEGSGADAVATQLTEGKDYRAEYSAHVDVGTVTVVYTGMGGFTGSIKKTYKITPYDLAKDTDKRITVVAENGKAYPQSYLYVKGGVKPLPVITYTSPKGKNYTLTKDSDYTLKYQNQTGLNDGSNTKKLPMISITGKGNFTGTRKQESFTITKAKIDSLTLTAADKVYAEKKGNFATSVTILDTDGKKLDAGKDYEKSFQYYYVQDTELADGTVRKGGDSVSEGDIVPAGTVLKIVVTGKGVYEGTVSGTYRMIGEDLSKASVKVNTQYYTGKEVCPDKSQIIITLKGKLLAAQDYEIVSYADNKNKGTAKVTVRGVGDYGGTKTADFKIETKPMYCVLSFHPNGASTGTMKDMKLTAGKDYTLTDNKYKRPAYIFTGWNTEPDGTGTKVLNKADSPFTVTQQDEGRIIVLYAQWEPVEYRISYHTNGGPNHALNTKSSYTAADENFVIYSPEREDWPKGYQFGGWYTENTYKNKIRTVKTGSSGDLELYAKWIPYTYTVQFDINAPESELNEKNASGSMKDEAFSYGVAKALDPNKFKRNGYVFAGWSLDKDAELPDYADEQIISADLLEKRNNIHGNVTLYAVWKKTFEITYETYGGTIGDSARTSYDYGDQVYSLPQEVTKAGYTFEGWYEDAAYKKKAKNIAKKSSGDKTFYAKWKPLSYKLVFDGNGSDAGKMKEQSMQYDTPAALRENSFVRKGYRFTGWSQTAGGIAAYTDQEAVNILPTVNNEKITLYAVWEETSYRITYETNGGTLTEAEENTCYKYDEENAFSLPVPVRDRYEFMGWYRDPQLKKAVTDISKGSYGDLSLYAKWKLKDDVMEFFVSYETNGGTIADNALDYITSYSYSTTETHELPIPERDGYVFAGWYRDAFFKTKVTKIPKKAREDYVLYAKWTGKKYQVSFMANEPAVTKSTGKTKKQTLVYGTEKALNKNGYKISGYSFLGWSTTPDEGVTATDGQKLTGTEWGDTFAAERTLYAVWERDTYGIIYNNMAGIKNENPDSYNIDSDTIVLKEPEMMGNTFLGWYSDERCTKKVTEIQQGSVGTKILYAKWAQMQYTLHYDLNCKDDTVVMDTSKAGYLTSFNKDADNGYLLPTATRRGYAFGGWYKEASCKNAVGYAIKTPYVDMTLYAKWVPVTYTVHFDKNDDQAAGSMKDMQSLQFGKEYTLTKNGYTKRGYEFVGWNTQVDGEGTFYSDRQKVQNLVDEQDGVMALYAMWEIVPYSITYHLNGGTNDETNPVTYTVEDDEITLKDATREGFTFLGWYTDSRYSASAKISSISKGSTGNLDLYAKWKERIVLEVQAPTEGTYLDVRDYYYEYYDGEDYTPAFDRALKAASQNAKTGGVNTVYVPAGRYPVTPGHADNEGDPGISLQSNTNLIMDNNAVLVVNSSSFDKYCVISGKDVHHITVTGGRIEGERYRHNGTSGEWGHGVALYGVTDIKISNMEIASNWGDGIYLGTYIGGERPNLTYDGCDNVTISHCEIYDSRRSNISLTDADNVTVEFCSIYDAHGTAPQCGIYVEPNFPSSGDMICRGITVRNTTITPYQNRRDDSEYMCFMTHYNPYKPSYVTADDIWFTDCTLNGYFGNYSGTNLHMQNTVITGPYVNKKG